MKPAFMPDTRFGIDEQPHAPTPDQAADTVTHCRRDPGAEAPRQSLWENQT